MHHGRTFVVAGIAAVCLLAGGVAFGLQSALATSPSSTPSAGPLVVRIGWDEDPDSLNPFIGYAQSAYESWSLNYDELVDIGPDGNFVPELATSVPTIHNGGISADGKVWTFKIRQGVKWQDGQPLTAADVAFTYNYMIQNHMKNYASATAAIVRAVVVDPATVRLICSRRKADMLTSYIPILPQHVWGKMSKQAAENTFTNPPPIIGSGPFQVTAFHKGQDVVMRRNPYFWGAKPALAQIVFEDYANADSMSLDLTSGALDAAVGLSSASFQTLAKEKRFDAVAYNFFFWDYVDLNCFTGPSLGNPVLRDPAFRRALATAIDNQKIVDVAWHGLAEVGTTIMNPHSWFNPDYHWQPTGADRFTFNIENAKQMLAAAGYRDVNGDGYVENKAGKPFSLRLWGRSESQPSQVEGKLLTQWWKEIGVKIVFSVVSEGYIDSQFWNTANGRFTPNFDMYLWDWDGYVDPGADLQTFTTAQIGNWNEPCWSNPEFDRLYKQQEVTLDPTKRQQIISQMQKLLYEAAGMIVLTYPDHLEAYNTAQWTGWTRNQAGHGGAFYTSYNRATYLNLRPAVGKGAGTKKGVWIGVGVAVFLVVVGGGVWLWFRVGRRGTRNAEEAQD